MHNGYLVLYAQIFIDKFCRFWYDKYVGVVLGCPLFSPVSAGIRRSKKVKEMTLDCLFFLRTSFSVKGHFCSFLLSNIIGYLAFLNLDCLLFIFSFFWFSRICFAWPLLLKKSHFLLASQILVLMNCFVHLIPDV